MLAEQGDSVVLYGDIHLDPELNSTGKEGVLTELGSVICKVRPHFVVVASDFNVPQSEYSLVTGMLKPGHILNSLHTPYDAGEQTNCIAQRVGSCSTQIDYALVFCLYGLKAKSCGNFHAGGFAEKCGDFGE